MRRRAKPKPIKPIVVFCPTCGSRVPEGAAYCPYCGRYLGDIKG